ncbi:STAS domain-containing protein [Saccharopolyspora sp. MS10]|uniref:STAS domain-containing protein n=1 Tax=Saccharopolyspora sp. MS10 TaxID=3385973 RepID=UPI0039A17E4D
MARGPRRMLGNRLSSQPDQAREQLLLIKGLAALSGVPGSRRGCGRVLPGLDAAALLHEREEDLVTIPTALFGATPVHPGRAPTHRDSTPEPAALYPRGRGWGVRQRVSRPNPDTIVLTVAGDIDAGTVGDFEEVLLPRLSATARLVVVDLSAVGFLGLAGLEVLRHAQLRAVSTGSRLRLVVGGHAVPHVLDRTGVGAELSCHPTLYAACDGRVG